MSRIGGRVAYSALKYHPIGQNLKGLQQPANAALRARPGLDGRPTLPQSWPPCRAASLPPACGAGRPSWAGAAAAGRGAAAESSPARYKVTVLPAAQQQQPVLQGSRWHQSKSGRERLEAVLQGKRSHQSLKSRTQQLESVL